MPGFIGRRSDSDSDDEVGKGGGKGKGKGKGKSKASVPPLSDLDEDLHKAAKNGVASEVERLLDAKADPSSRDARMGVPLHGAAYNGHSDVAKLLLDALPTAAEMQTFEGWTPLHRAIVNAHVDVVKLIVDACPFAAQVQDDEGNTPLHEAGNEGRTTIIPLLLEAYPPAALVKNNDGSTPVHLAALWNHISAVEIILKACPEAVLVTGNNSGWTLLHTSAVNGQYEIVQLVVAAHPALVQAKNDEGKTPLQLAEEDMSPLVPEHVSEGKEYGKKRCVDILKQVLIRVITLQPERNPETNTIKVTLFAMSSNELATFEVSHEDHVSKILKLARLAVGSNDALSFILPDGSRLEDLAADRLFHNCF